jgi:uncharacterized protein
MPKYIHNTAPFPDQRMVDFIRAHHVMTVATGGGSGNPWVASCFYAYVSRKNWFVFTTDDDTRHGREMIANPVIAVSIALETKITGQIRGVQMTGRALKCDSTNHFRASRAFLGRFPVAALRKTTLWIFEPEHIKMTDNRLGFGVKLVWEKGVEEANIAEKD